MKEVSELDKQLFVKLVEAQHLTMSQKNEMIRLVRTYIDEGASMCMTCDPQVVAMWRRLKAWWALFLENKS